MTDASFLAALEKGIELFNAQKFFEAYEVWEEKWNEEESDGADLLQGLLQVAVGFSKLQEGHARAAIKLLETAKPKLELYAPEAYDVDVDAMLELVAEYQAIAERLLEGGAAEAVAPKLSRR